MTRCRRVHFITFFFTYIHTHANTLFSHLKQSSGANFKGLMRLKIPYFAFNENATLQIKKWPQRLSDVCVLAGSQGSLMIRSVQLDFNLTVSPLWS